MATVIYAAGQGYMDDLPLTKIADFEQGLLSFLRTSHSNFMNKVNESGNYNDEIAKEMQEIVEAYKSSYV